MPKPTVFVSYSHRDRAWKDRLVQHLKILEREGRLDAWDDGRIGAGATWLSEIEEAIARARVAVLLISVDFLNSGFIRDNEVPAILARRQAEGLLVIPVIVGECLWDQVPEIASIQARPLDGKPLAGFSVHRRNREITAIAREILNLVGGASPSPSINLANVAPVAPRPIRHQLPAPPGDFVGRTEELAALRAEIHNGGATICGLRGQGGVGKTALALVLAQEMSAEYPDAQIFLDLQGVSERSVSSAEAMAHVIRAFLPDAQLPEGPQLAALYRDVLSGQRVLLLMDNASDREQVEPLIPPAGSILLVTSRERFALPGLAYRNLDLLPDEDARALLVEIEPRIGERAAEIALLCGYLPFALRVAASTLLERPDLSVEEYEKRLGREKDRAELGERALGLGYALLLDAFQERYRHLAVFAGDFDAPAAGTVWGLGEEETDETLGAFVRRSLLDGKDGRYKVHDLARAFAASRLSEDEKTLGQLRHAEHYCGVLEQATSLYEDGKENLLPGLALFDRERPQIAAGQAWAAEKLQVRKEAARLANEYPNAGIYVLRLRLNPREQIAWLEAGLAGAQQAKDRKMEGHHLGNLGFAYAELGETRRAIESYEQRLAIAREIGDRCGEGNVLGNLGLAYLDLGETRRAIEYYEQHLAIAREIGNRRGEEIALGNLGSAYVALGETRRAIEYCEQALLIDREIGDRRGEGSDLGNLGIAYAHLGENRRAIEYYEQQLVITREIGDRRGEGNASWNLGLEYEKQGDRAQAIELMQVRVDYERELGHPDAEKHAAEVETIRARLKGTAE